MTFFNIFFFFDFLFMVHCIYILNFVVSSPRRLLAMICVLLNYAFFLILLKLEYLAFIVVIIYVGAVSVIFLFIIMLVNVLQTVFYTRENGFLLFSFVFIFTLLWFFSFVALEDIFFKSSSGYFLQTCLPVFEFNDSKVFVSYVLNKKSLFFFNNFDFLNLIVFDSLNSAIIPLIEIEQLGFLLWTKYSVFVILSGLILVFSIIGGISILKSIFLLTMEKRSLLRKNNLKI